MSTTANVKTTGKESENNFVGIDVAKDELVLHLLPSEKKLTAPNSTQGFKQLHNLFKDHPPTQIVCEATGGLERPLADFLYANGYPIVVVNKSPERSEAQ
jgi:transposase